jgi:putative transposase
LLTVIRYVECNPLPAGLVHAAEHWPWSSLPASIDPPPLPFLHPGPVPWPAIWVSHVNTPLYQKDLKRFRYSARRETPFGDCAWTEAAARNLGLEDTLRPSGRPRKADATHGSRQGPQSLHKIQ